MVQGKSKKTGPMPRRIQPRQTGLLIFLLRERGGEAEREMAKEVGRLRDI